MSKCNHKWVDMEDGSLRKFCVRCAKFALQAQMAIPVKTDVAEKSARETMDVPFTGGDRIAISVDTESFFKETGRALGLDIAQNILQEFLKNGY